MAIARIGYKELLKPQPFEKRVAHGSLHHSLAVWAKKSPLYWHWLGNIQGP